LYANKQARTEYMNRKEIEKVSKNRLVFSNYWLSIINYWMSRLVSTSLNEYFALL